MTDRILIAAAILAGAGWLSVAASAQAPNPQSRIESVSHPEETAMTHIARGPFDVKLAPLPPYNAAPEAKFGRMSIDKQFHGELEAVSQGEMLSAMGEVQGSAGYVAIERVTGTLDGRSGSFSLQHDATMNRGAPALNIIVVPDSGTGELTGLSGRMNIRIEAGGKHFYELDYSLPALLR